MSHTKSTRFSKAKAEVVLKITNPCVFCGQILDDEISYGKQYSIGDIECHYFCVLLSCCLIQKGKDSDGLFGFMYLDIVQEVERSKKHKCSYCGKEGATLGCSVGHCRKQFHLPCGRQKDAVSLFYGNYKSFCQNHIPKQKISEEVMAKARLRRKNKRLNNEKPQKVEAIEATNKVTETAAAGEVTEAESVCVVCYEEVEGFPTPRTFWPPCCARDAWFHRRCIERMALNAGMHYLKCPLCNDKERFYEEVVDQGYYVPDRDAAWELEAGAYADMAGAARACCAAACRCARGRRHDDEHGLWDLVACVLCGSVALHVGCASPSPSPSAALSSAMVCSVCQQANPTSELLAQIAKVPLTPERSRPAELGPVMPSRMSLRRTKRRPAASTSSTSCPTKQSRLELNLKSPKKPERVQEASEVLDRNVLCDINNRVVSPLKLFEITFTEKINSLGVSDDVKIDSKSVLEKVRKKLNKPKPLSAKKKIVNDILDGLIDDLMKENTKAKSPVQNWRSPVKMTNDGDALDKPTNKTCTEVKFAGGKTTPKKTQPQNADCIELVSEDHKQNEECDNKDDFKGVFVDDEDTNSTFQLSPEFVAENYSDDSLPFINTPKKLKMVDIQDNSAMEISIDQVVNVNLVKMVENDAKTITDFIKDVVIKSPERNEKCAFKFSPIDKETLQKSNVGIDLEIFKNQYLNEVDKEFMCSHAQSGNKNSVETKSAKKAAKDVKRLNVKRKVGVGLQKDKKHKKKHRKTIQTRSLQKNSKVIKVHEKRGKNYTKLKIKLKSRKKKVKKSQECGVDSVTIRCKDINIKNNKKNRKSTLTTRNLYDKVLGETKTLKQTVLPFGSPQKTSELLETTPKIRRKKVKLEKSPDGLKQTSLQNFFKKTVV